MSAWADSEALSASKYPLKSSAPLHLITRWLVARAAFFCLSHLEWQNVTIDKTQGERINLGRPLEVAFYFGLEVNILTILRKRIKHQLWFQQSLTKIELKISLA